MTRRAVPIALLALAAGCAPEELGAKGTLDLWLRVDSAGVELLAESFADGPAGPDAGDGALSWELDGDAGTAGDPRKVRAEVGGDAPDVLAPVGVLEIRVPNRAGWLRVRDASGLVLGEVRVAELTPSDEQDLIDLSHDLVGPPRPVVDHGGAHDVRLLILPEGYREEELGAFHADVDRLLATLATIPGYREHWSSIDVWTQDIRSRDSGIADPAAGIDRTTAFEVSFGDGVHVPRRLITTQASVQNDVLVAARKLARAVRADATILLANVDEWAGAGGEVAALSRHPNAARILAHELGHRLFRLHDEYDGGGVKCQPQALGAALNLAVRLDRLPWNDLLTTTALPTHSSDGDDVIGAFEGGGYCAQGVFRGQKNCTMREAERDFCRVCLREIDRYFERRTH
jgi:hypothetical protein